MAYDETADECDVVQRLSERYRAQRKTMNIAKTLELEKTKKIDGEFNGVAFTFEAKTNAVTPRFMQRIADVRERPIEMANGLAGLITGWDIDMDGEPFPPTPENLADLPMDFLSYLMDQIVDAISAEAKGKGTDKMASAAVSKANG